jgi:hypothetical protein
LENQEKNPAGLRSIFFSSLDSVWEELRKFFYKQKTIETVLFLLIYTIEQLSLFWFVLEYPKNVFELVAVFIIIFLSTISFERICMNSRLGNYNSLLSDAKLSYNREKSENDLLRAKLEEQQKEITSLKKKSLNMTKLSNTVKR